MVPILPAALGDSSELPRSLASKSGPYLAFVRDDIGLTLMRLVGERSKDPESKSSSTSRSGARGFGVTLGLARGWCQFGYLSLSSIGGGVKPVLASFALPPKGMYDDAPPFWGTVILSEELPLFLIRKIEALSKAAESRRARPSKNTLRPGDCTTAIDEIQGGKLNLQNQRLGLGSES